MRNIFLLLVFIFGLSFIQSCNDDGPDIILSPIAQRAIADSSFIYYDDFSYSSENISELPIGIFDTSIDGLFAVEQFLTLDKFDNITGKPVPDGIPDFGGENFQFLIDKANGPYIDYIEAGNTAFLKEHLMTNVFFLMGKSFYTLQVDDFKSGQKERVKAVIALTNSADYIAESDISNFSKATGSNVIVIGLMSSGINALFEECVSKEQVSIGILSSGDDITVREYESAIRKKAAQSEYDGVLKIVGHRAHGLNEAILMDYDYISMLSTETRANYKGPDLVKDIEYVDEVVLERYGFNTSENGLLYTRRNGEYQVLQLNSIENYVRYHVVSMVEHHRRSGSDVPISCILLSDYKFSSVKGLIEKVLVELYNYRLDGMYLYRNSITPNVKLIDPVECAARECYMALRESRNLALRAVRSELDTYITVPALSFDDDSYDEDGGFSYNYRIGRPAGEYKITSKAIPFSTRYLERGKLNYMGNYFPLSYSLIKNSLY